MDKEFALEWYNEGLLSDPELPTFDESRVFLYRGKGGQGGTETTHDEIKQWIVSKMPPVEKRAEVKPVDY